MSSIPCDAVLLPSKELAQKAIAARATTYTLGEGFGVGYIDPEYEVTQELHDLQDAVVSAINPLRAGMRAKDIAKMSDATGVKLQNFQAYGYGSIGELFRPHITLTRLKEHRPEILDALPDIRSFDGLFDKVGLYEMGDNGTCVRELCVFDLAGK